MGRTFLFECAKCGYRAKVSGGEDRGIHFAVKTIHCADCRELYDAVTDVKMPAAAPLNRWKLKTSRLDAPKTPRTPPKFLAVLNRLPPKGKRFRWVHFKPVCPVSTLHRVTEWTSPGKCPKCGILMECNALPYRRWE